MTYLLENQPFLLFVFLEFLFQKQWIEGLLPFQVKESKRKRLKLISKAVKEQCQNIGKHASNRILPDVRSVIRKTGEHGKTFEVWSLEKKKTPPSILLYKENYSLKIDGDISAFQDTHQSTQLISLKGHCR